MTDRRPSGGMLTSNADICGVITDRGACGRPPGEHAEAPPPEVRFSEFLRRTRNLQVGFSGIKDAILPMEPPDDGFSEFLRRTRKLLLAGFRPQDIVVGQHLQHSGTGFIAPVRELEGLFFRMDCAALVRVSYEDIESGVWLVLPSRVSPSADNPAGSVRTIPDAGANAGKKLGDNAMLPPEYSEAIMRDGIKGALPTVGQIEVVRDVDDKRHPFLLYFRWDHLPAKLQEVSRPFDELARRLIHLSPPALATDRSRGQLDRALEKLLEAKDCAVRAAMG